MKDEGVKSKTKRWYWYFHPPFQKSGKTNFNNIKLIGVIRLNESILYYEVW